MDDVAFDRLAQSLAQSGSRRRLLAGLAAGTLGLAGLGRADAAACRPVGSVCREGAGCCSGNCGPKDRTGRRRCQCGADADCPVPDACHAASCTDGACGVTATVDVATDPAHCGGCGRACPAVANGAPTCSAGTCGVECDNGYFEANGACHAQVGFGGACGASKECASGVCACHSLDCGSAECATSNSPACSAVPVQTPEGSAPVCIVFGTSSVCREAPCQAGEACGGAGFICYVLAQ